MIGIPNIIEEIKSDHTEDYDDIETLNLSNELFSIEMLQTLPKNLKELIIVEHNSSNEVYDEYNAIFEEDATRYEDKDIKINSIFFYKIPNNLPENLVELRLYNNELRIIESLPKNLKLLSIARNWYLDKLPSLPESLEELDIRYTKINNLPNYPTNLKNICVSYWRTVFDIGLFSENIEAISIVDSPIKKLELSSNRVPLKLSYINICSVPNLTEISKELETINGSWREDSKDNLKDIIEQNKEHLRKYPSIEPSFEVQCSHCNSFMGMYYRFPGIKGNGFYSYFEYDKKEILCKYCYELNEPDTYTTSVICCGEYYLQYSNIFTCDKCNNYIELFGDIYHINEDTDDQMDFCSTCFNGKEYIHNKITQSNQGIVPKDIYLQKQN